ncbi:transposase [Liquorilactobacillus ghanensis]
MGLYFLYIVGAIKPIEGINRKIKALKRICYGFKNMDHFYARIILILK